MLISFFDFRTNHTEGPKSQAGGPQCKAKDQAHQVPVKPEKAEGGPLPTRLIILGNCLKHCTL